MNAKLAGMLVLGVVFGLVLTGGMSQQNSGLHPNAAAQGPAHDRTAPPDLKPGVKLAIRAGEYYVARIDGNAKVTKVQGNWVYIEGDFYNGIKNIGEGWVNFDTVTWYRVLK